MVSYRHELISMANLTVSPFLTKLTKPFFITSILLLLLEYAICIIRAVGGVDLIANTVYQALFLLVNIPCAIYFAWISVKVLRFLTSKALDKKKKRFRKVSPPGPIVDLITKYCLGCRLLDVYLPWFDRPDLLARVHLRRSYSAADRFFHYFLDGSSVWYHDQPCLNLQLSAAT